MSPRSFQIRVCNSCGLRYPLTDDQSFGERCPVCLGSTEAIATHPLGSESGASFHDPASPERPEGGETITPTAKSAKTAKEKLNLRDFRGPGGSNNQGKAKLPRNPERRREFSALLDNIRSAWNVGSMFRTADGFGLGHIHLCGITPTPEADAVRKTSLGAEETIPWAYHKDAVKLVQKLKIEGWKILALEEHERAKPISQLPNSQFTNPTLLIVGNEVTGVDPGILDLCDEIYFIPMHGQKKSFNVAVAFAVAVSQMVL